MPAGCIGFGPLVSVCPPGLHDRSVAFVGGGGVLGGIRLHFGSKKDWISRSEAQGGDCRPELEIGLVGNRACWNTGIISIVFEEFYREVQSYFEPKWSPSWKVRVNDWGRPFLMNWIGCFCNNSNLPIQDRLDRVAGNMEATTPRFYDVSGMILFGDFFVKSNHIHNLSLSQIHLPALIFSLSFFFTAITPPTP